jgi:hypothetical protein
MPCLRDSALRQSISPIPKGWNCCHPSKLCGIYQKKEIPQSFEDFSRKTVIQESPAIYRRQWGMAAIKTKIKTA